jgi:uncharacterized protein (UPF0303 family)
MAFLLTGAMRLRHRACRSSPVHGVKVSSALFAGLPEREDHGVIVDTLCDHLGIKRKTLALPAKAD